MLVGDFVSPETALEQIHDPHFSGSLLFAVDAPDLDSTICAAETAMAERFEVDRSEEGLLLLKFALGSTWTSIENFYGQKQHAKPQTLLTDIDLTGTSANVRYTVPLTKVGMARKAVAATYHYEKVEGRHSRSDRSSMKLTRRASTKMQVIDNPFATPVQSTCDPNMPRISDHRIFMKKAWNGTL